ncbi:efflux RND transporter periplasmic adaptor subunit [Marinobacterium jannaschii]|uniref:efflux RND transporter periplasmic adaptor subunit n=1 Tax=Marinobacterium jannaschii TaxID=64970 RepID=UPI000486FD46|nr:efflux RND transporter periplasmic adaptor subunit [Marinobacterium jannaschii]
MKLKTLVISLLALASLPAVWFYNAYALEHKPQPPARTESPVLPAVSVITLQPRTATAVISAFGNVESAHTLTLKTRLSSRVIWKSEQFKPGNQIRQGALLARLETTDYQLALAQAEQQKAEALLALQQAEEQARQAERDWQRAGLKNATASALLLHKPQLAAAKAALQSADARLIQARRDLKECEIRAPFNAIVAATELSLYSLTAPGDTLATLIASDTAEIHIALSPAQWPLLDSSPAQASAILRNPQQPQQQWPARLERIASQLDHSTRLRQLTLAVDQPLQQSTPLLPGSFVSVELQGRAFDNLLALPHSAISADGYFWSVHGGQLQRHRADIVFSHQAISYIRAGSDSPLQVVAKAVASYQPGMQVTLKEHSDD